jgi:predicted HTH transcriptional regulator
MDKKYNRRAMDRISPQLFTSALKKEAFRDLADDTGRPAIQCYDSVTLSPDFIQEILRWTVALANTHGGLILFNAIFNDETLALTLNRIPRKRLQQLKEKLTVKIAADIEPALEVRIWMIEVKNPKDQYILVLRIPASRACPHMVTGNEENAIYIYHSDSAIRAGLNDIEQLFHRKLARRINMSVSGDSLNVDLTEEELNALFS